MAEKTPTAAGLTSPIPISSNPGLTAVPTMPGKSSKLGIIPAVLLALAIGGAVTWLLGSHDRGEAAAGNKAEKLSPAIVHLEGFTVNLADKEGNRFLRVSMDLAIDHVPPPATRDKPFSGLPMSRMRDSILSVLTVCKSDALLTAEGKERLKTDLRVALNHDNPELGVREIYFTEFLVQR
jgi:flagellar protein FliL